MASNIQGGLIQGSLDEGQPAANERPVLVAGKDTATGNIADLPIIGGALVVTTAVGGAITANQGAPNAGGTANAWFIQGAQANASAITENPVLIAGQFGGNVKLLALDTNGQPTANQGTVNGAGTNSWAIQGAAGGGGAVTGNPVLLGISDGTNVQTWRQWDGTNNTQPFPGIPLVLPGMWNSTNAAKPLQTAAPDAAANTTLLGVHNSLYNGTNFDRARNNIDVTLLASLSRTTTQTSADITTYNLAGISVFLNMTVVGTGSVTLTINGKDPASGVYYNILTGAAVVTNSGNLYRIQPGIPAVANKDVNAYLPRVIQIVVTANNANAATYSVGYTLHNP